MSAQHSLLNLCQQYNAILLQEDASSIRIALASEPPTQFFEALRFISDKSINIEYWNSERLEKAHFEHTPTPTDERQVTTLSAVAILDETLQKAIKLRASDIHFEPTAEHYRIRLRIDGVLQLQPLLPHTLAAAITARLKVLGNLDIAERRLPQDGQLDIKTDKQKLSFRISTLPVHYGEKVVLRLLHQKTQPPQLDTLGLSSSDCLRLRNALIRPQGMILVTGPTGSGKTITLYSALNELNKTSANICSVEDPIEIPLQGLNQTQVNIKADLTFQGILRALLRQDPDIIMIGEIRDVETAEIAVIAAQTGHLVLATLHTNSTVETLIRLEQMGIPRWMLASALHMIVAQRLVRKLCPYCKQRLNEDIILPPHIWPAPLPHWKASGCERCYGGFYGRQALFEIMPVGQVLRNAIIQEASITSLETIAREQGMKTLFENGCQIIAEGLTTIEELYHVIGVPHG